MVSLPNNCMTVKLYVCYFQVCRNINQIKFCMDTGRTVILLNLEHLYESLYDVLNQVNMFNSNYFKLFVSSPCHVFYSLHIGSLQH